MIKKRTFYPLERFWPGWIYRGDDGLLHNCVDERFVFDRHFNMVKGPIERKADVEESMTDSYNSSVRGAIADGLRGAELYIFPDDVMA